MKLYQSKVLSELDRFRCNPGFKHDLMRDHEGIFLNWKVMEYFQPKSILEIGFGCGQTLAMMYESSGASRILSVDLWHNGKNNFIELFPEATIEWKTIDSKTLDINEKFDFILIDGDHSYLGASNDIVKSINLMHEKSILCIDDYYWKEIDVAIKDKLLTTELVPFLAGYQQIYFHYPSHDVGDFLDRFLLDDPRFMQYSLQDYYDHNITKGKLYETMFIENLEIFQLALKFFNQ